MSSASTYLQKLSKVSEKNTYVSRKEQVEKVKGKIPTVCENHKDDVNSRIENVKTYLSAGIKGLYIGNADIIDSYCDELDALKEKDSDDDLKLAEAKQYLSFEISDCDSKIEDLDSQIASLETQYQNELAAEREAARRAAEEAKRRAEEAARRAAEEARRQAEKAAEAAKKTVEETSSTISKNYNSVKKKVNSVFK